MLKKINQRYVGYIDNKMMYALDLDSNFWSLFLGVGHTYFNKKGYIVERLKSNNKNKNIKNEKPRLTALSISLSCGIAVMFVVLGRILWDDIVILDFSKRIIASFILFFILLLLRVVWSIYQKKQFLKNNIIIKKINVKLDYGQKNKKTRLKGTLIMNGLFYCLCLIATGLFLISGSITAYVLLLMTQICILFFGIFAISTERNSTGLYDVKIIPSSNFQT